MMAAPRRSVIDAAAHHEVSFACGRYCLCKALQMIRSPDVVVTDVTNPVATSAADAFIVGIALASGVLRQVAPPDILMREGTRCGLGLIRAAIANHDQSDVANAVNHARWNSQ